MRILHVEDDPLNRKVMRAILEMANIVPDEAVDGAEGLECIENGDYDLVLMDIRMPRMDGLSAIRLIRGRTDNKAFVPIIAVTADPAKSMKESCLAAGANSILSKPYGSDELYAIISAELAKATKQLELA